MPMEVTALASLSTSSSGASRISTSSTQFFRIQSSARARSATTGRLHSAPFGSVSDRISPAMR